MSMPAAIAFDVYGTLLHIRDRCDPYKRLLLETKLDRLVARRLIMTQNLTMPELLDALEIVNLDPALVEDEVRAEIESTAVYQEVPRALGRLRDGGYRIAVISNLAPPYAEPIRSLLGRLVDVAVLSFDVGTLKPDPAIFRAACDRLDHRPDEVVMVGDSIESDVNGALAAGMRSVLVDRLGRHSQFGGARVTSLAVSDFPKAIAHSLAIDDGNRRK